MKLETPAPDDAGTVDRPDPQPGPSAAPDAAVPGDGGARPPAQVRDEGEPWPQAPPAPR